MPLPFHVVCLANGMSDHTWSKRMIDINPVHGKWSSAMVSGSINTVSLIFLYLGHNSSYCGDTNRVNEGMGFTFPVPAPGSPWMQIWICTPSMPMSKIWTIEVCKTKCSTKDSQKTIIHRKQQSEDSPHKFAKNLFRCSVSVLFECYHYVIMLSSFCLGSNSLMTGTACYPLFPVVFTTLFEPHEWREPSSVQ